MEDGEGRRRGTSENEHIKQVKKTRRSVDIANERDQNESRTELERVNLLEDS
jgi:hypothetical protein